MEQSGNMLVIVGLAVVYLTASAHCQFDSCTHLETCLKVEQRECDASGSRLICILPVSECYDENIAQSGPNGGFSLCVTGEPAQYRGFCTEGDDCGNLVNLDAVCKTVPTTSATPVSFSIGGSRTITLDAGDGPGSLEVLLYSSASYNYGVTLPCPTGERAAVTCEPRRSNNKCDPLESPADLYLTITVTPLPCPVNGRYTNWAHATCSATCGEGTGYRTRTCTDPAPAYCGEDCTQYGADTETAISPCNLGPCPVDGGFTEWAITSRCSVTCGAGTFIQTRECSNPLPLFGGSDCRGDMEQPSTVACTPIVVCPVDGFWSNWVQTGECAATCGEDATAIFTRQCTGQAGSGLGCSGVDTKESQCIQPVPNCPVNGGYSDWMTVGDCSATCGSGRQTRQRICNNPVPQFGGSDCSSSGADIQTEFVCESNNVCPTEGGFTEWSQWGSCSATCGLGSMERTRTCTMPAPMDDGTACQGPASDSRVCFIKSCDVSGNWGDWQLGTCSVTCGTGSQTDTRMCNNPTPVAAGQTCPGDSTRIATCNPRICDVNGGFTEWQSGTCSVTCGTGTLTRTRSCTNPPQAGNGQDCTGITTQTGFQCTKDCDGGWSDFGKYDVCSRTCGGGTQTKSRTCTNPEPAGNGQNCPGSSTENRACNTQACVGTQRSSGTGGGRCRETSGRCTVTCGSGSRIIKKICGGTLSTTSVPCNLPACPNQAPLPSTRPPVSAQNGGYGPWSNWGSCSVTCQTPGIQAIQRAVRVCNDPPPSNSGLNCINGGLGEAEKSRNCLIPICPVVDGSSTVQLTTPLICEYNERVCGLGLQCCRRKNNGAVRGGNRRNNQQRQNNVGRRNRNRSVKRQRRNRIQTANRPITQINNKARQRNGLRLATAP